LHEIDTSVVSINSMDLTLKLISALHFTLKYLVMQFGFSGSTF